MINQAPIVRYTVSVSEKFFPNFWRKTFSAESHSKKDPMPCASPFFAWLRLAPHPPLPPQIIPTEVCAGPTPLPTLVFEAKKRFGLSVLNYIW